MLLGISCQKEDLSLENTANQNFEIENRTNETESRRTNYTQVRPVVLGDEYINPYEIGIVNQAIANLYPNGTPVHPTHKYVKFVPNDHQDLVDIMDWAHINDIVMFDHPLTYEIIEEGDYYIGSQITDEVLSPQYCSVDIGLLMPNAPNEILQELYLDESNPFIFIETYINTGHTDKLDDTIGEGIAYDDVIEFMPVNTPCPIDIINAPPTCPDNCYPFLFLNGLDGIGGLDGGTCYWKCICDNPPPVIQTNTCGCVIPSNIKIPSGCVQVQNDNNADAPVRIAKIAVWDWNFPFKKSNITYTDERGCWRLNRTYNECRMKVIFENDNLKVRSMQYWLSLRVLRDRTRVFNNPPYNNINILYNAVVDRREWGGSHTLNTDFIFRERASVDMIAQPRTRINFLISDGILGGSAPMLQNVSNPLGLPFVNQFLPDFLPTIGDIMPDITNSYGNNRTARNFNRIGFHELAHAAHHSLVSEGYWLDFRNHVIYNLGDGTFGNFTPIGSSPELVALGEAIAEYFEDRYGGTGNGEITQWRSGYIPSGMLWDLEDAVSIGEFITHPTTGVFLTRDVISGYTPAMFFNSLDPTIRSVRSFRNRLSTLHLADAPNTLNNHNNFIDAYDLFN